MEEILYTAIPIACWQSGEQQHLPPLAACYTENLPQRISWKQLAKICIRKDLFSTCCKGFGSRGTAYELLLCASERCQEHPSEFSWMNLLNVQQQALLYNAGAEIGTGFVVILNLLTPPRNIFLVFIHWQWLRMRYWSPDSANHHRMVNLSHVIAHIFSWLLLSHLWQYLGSYKLLSSWH